MKTNSRRLPRILKINDVNGLTISVLFGSGQDRLLDFNKILQKLKVGFESPENKLLDPKELKKAEIRNYTLSWPNIQTTVKLRSGKTLTLPYEIGADVLFKMSEPDFTREDINIGEILKDLRRKEGMTQDEVAYLSGTSRTYISKIENNKSDIELFTLEKIVKAGFNRRLRIQII